MIIYIFKYNRWRVLKKAWAIYLCFIGQLYIIIYEIYISGLDLLAPMNLMYALIPNIIFSILSIPCFIIHRNYLMYSKNHTLTITDTSITIKTKQEEKTVEYLLIKKINIYETSKMSRSPWNRYYWYEFIDDSGNVIKINCYLAPMNKIWDDFLKYKVDLKNVAYNTKIEKGPFFLKIDFTFPLVK